MNEIIKLTFTILIPIIISLTSSILVFKYFLNKYPNRDKTDLILYCITLSSFLIIIINYIYILIIGYFIYEIGTDYFGLEYALPAIVIIFIGFVSIIYREIRKKFI